LSIEEKSGRKESAVAEHHGQLVISFSGELQERRRVNTKVKVVNKVTIFVQPEPRTPRETVPSVSPVGKPESWKGAQSPLQAIGSPLRYVGLRAASRPPREDFTRIIALILVVLFSFFWYKN